MSPKVGKILWRIIPVLIVLLLLPEIVLLVVSLFYKEDLKSMVLDDVNTRIQGKVTVGDIQLSHFVNWPFISLKINNINVAYQKDSTSSSRIFKASTLAIQVNPLQALAGKIVVRRVDLSGVQVLLLIEKDGNSNLNIFKPITKRTAGKEGKLNLNIRKVALDSVYFQFKDESKDKNIALLYRRGICKINRLSDATTLELNGKVFFEGLGFNRRKGAFLKDTESKINISAKYYEQQRLFEFTQALITYNSYEYAVQGTIGFADSTMLDLYINAPNTGQAEVLKLLPERVAAKIAPYKIRGLVQGNAHVFGKASGGVLPKVDVYFTLKGNDIMLEQIGLLLYDTKLTGHFTNHVNEALPSNDLNSAININHIKTTVFGANMSARCIVDDLINPRMKMYADIQCGLDTVQQFLDKEKIDLAHLSGRLSANIMYDALLNQWIAKGSRRLPGTLQGQITLYDVGLNLGTGNFPVRNISGKFKMKNDSIYSGKFNFRLPGGYFHASGSISSLYSYLTKGKAPLNINLSTRSQKVDLEQMFTTTASKNHEPSDAHISDLPTQTVVGRFNLKIQQLKFKRLEAQQVKGELRFNKSHIDIPMLSFNTAKGKALLEGTLHQPGKKRMAVQTKLRLQNMDISKVLYMVHDFGQKSLTHKHLSGNLSAEVLFKGTLNDDLSLVKADNAGEASFSIQHARLLHFEPFKKISGLLFRNRNFDDVRFAEIVGQVYFKGNELEFPTIELSSNVLTMYVKGEYNFDNDEEMDLRIAIPFNNLMHRDQNRIPDKTGVEGADKAGVNLKVTRKNGVTDISLDLQKTVQRLKNLVNRRYKKKEEQARKADSTYVK